MKIHFIGIGGIGVSALAQYYLNKGHRVTGSDLASSEIVELLKEKGIKISLGAQENLPEDLNLVIYSPAVQKDNPEYIKAKKKGIKLLSYPEALGEVSKDYYTIAVSGTHGKSTTSSMLSLVLIEAGLDPTVIIGTKLKEFNNSNFRPARNISHSDAGGTGESQYLIIEADEWNASFLNYHPNIIVLTNIEEEHLDYYRDLDHILNTYSKYISNLDKNGYLVINQDDENIKKVANREVIKYSLSDPESKKIKEILKIPGEHNIYNGLAVLKVARILKIEDNLTYNALSKYKGSWRRFDQRGNIIHDYGHHPTEVKATLGAIREKFPDKNIWCIFQPHQYQRTYFLLNKFINVLSSAPVDKLILTDIYDVAGREKGDIREKINSKKLADLVNKDHVIYIPQEEVRGYIEENTSKEDIIVVMGAGDVYKILDKD